MFLTPMQFDIIIGIILGDAYIRKMNANGQPYIQFNQGFSHLPYVLFLFQFLGPICTHYPSLIQNRDGTFYLQIYTRCLSCLRSIYEIFVINGVKTIPANIAYYLTPCSLAFWAMDDGSASESGFYLNTHSYSMDEQIILQQALKSKFNLDTNIHKHGDLLKLYIKASSMPTFRALVHPYFCPAFYYKLYPKIYKKI